MEIVIYSTLVDYPGRLTLQTDVSATVGELLKLYCDEQVIYYRRHLVLRNRDQVILDLKQTLGHYSLTNGDVLYVGSKGSENNESWFMGCNQWWLLSTIAFVIGAVGLVSITVMKFLSTGAATQYGIVFDAGSSHTKMYIYSWPGLKTNGTGVAKQDFECSTAGGGISQYAANPAQAGPTLTGCLSKAQSHIPDVQYKGTPVYLGATAGMRLLDLTNASQSNKVLSSVRSSISKAPFAFKTPQKQARIITGREEGAFGWVTVNYLVHSLKQVSQEMKISLEEVFGVTEEAGLRTYGSLDLGGASTQIAFIPARPDLLPKQYRSDLQLFGDSYTIYSHSYLCFGLNEAHRRLIAEVLKSEDYSTTATNPCAPTGNVTTLSHDEVFGHYCTKEYVPAKAGQTYTIQGSSDSALCNALVLRLFPFNASCSDPPCTFGGVHQPPLHGHFLGYSGFFFLMEFLNLTNSNFRLETFVTRTERLCNMTWRQLPASTPTDACFQATFAAAMLASLGFTGPELHLQVSRLPAKNPHYLGLYCFQSHYVRSLLSRGYGFDSRQWSLIKFQNQVSRSELGWTLGMMLNASNNIPPLKRDSFNTTLFVFLVALFVVFFVCSVGFACQARALNKKFARYRRLQPTYGAVDA